MSDKKQKLMDIQNFLIGVWMGFNLGWSLLLEVIK